MVAKKTTIEDLAIMVQRGFKETAKQADMDKRFEQVDKRFEHVDKRFEQIDRRLEIVDGHLSHIDARLNTIEHDVADIRKHFVYRDEFEDALARISLLEKKLGVHSGK